MPSFICRKGLICFKSIFSYKITLHNWTNTWVTMYHIKKDFVIFYMYPWNHWIILPFNKIFCATLDKALFIALFYLHELVMLSVWFSNWIVTTVCKYYSFWNVMSFKTQVFHGFSFCPALTVIADTMKLSHNVAISFTKMNNKCWSKIIIKYCWLFRFDFSAYRHLLKALYGWRGVLLNLFK